MVFSSKDNNADLNTDSLSNGLQGGRCSCTSDICIQSTSLGSPIFSIISVHYIEAEGSSGLSVCLVGFKKSV